MAFAYTRTVDTVTGNLHLMAGTYTQGNGDTGGAIVTGLKDIKTFWATGATKVVNSAGTVTITTADPGADVTGYWEAKGY